MTKMRIEYGLGEKQIVLRNTFYHKDALFLRGAKYVRLRRYHVLDNTYLNYVWLSQDMREHIKNPEDLIDPTLGKEEIPPLDHQRLLLELFREKEKCLFLADPGTGKSKAAVMAMLSLPQPAKVLVVSPANIMPNFYNQVIEHGRGFLSPIIVQGTAAQRRKILGSQAHDVFIISYNNLKSEKAHLIHKKFDLIVFDEVHNICNRKAQCTKVSKAVAGSIPYRIGMTGTLIGNGLQDVWSPCNVIQPAIFGEVWNNFNNRYLIWGGYHREQSVRTMGGYMTKKIPTEIIGVRNEDEIKQKLASISLKFSIDDVVDLPPIIVKEEIYSLTKTEEEDYMKIIADKELEPMSKSFQLQRYLSQSKSKLSLLNPYLSQLKNHKVVIWCRFKETMSFLEDHLKNKFKVMVYNGDTKDKSLYMKFENSDEPMIMIAQISMSAGWEIPSCKYAIFYELDYSSRNNEQARGRIRRLKGSQAGSCVYTYILGKGTIEPAIIESIKSKDFTAKDAEKHIQGKELLLKK